MKRWWSLFLCLAILLSASGCGGEPAALGVAEEICRALSLPLGITYSPRALSHEEGYLSPSLRLALFGEEGSALLSLAKDGAVFLGFSSEEPLEFALLRLPTHAIARQMASALSARLSLLRRLSPTSPHLIGAQVWIRGNWAIYTVLPDNAAAQSALARLL